MQSRDENGTFEAENADNCKVGSATVPTFSGQPRWAALHNKAYLNACGGALICRNLGHAYSKASCLQTYPIHINCRSQDYYTAQQRILTQRTRFSMLE
jgi:hypothetical protein